MRKYLALITLALAFATGCEEKSSGITTGTKAVANCALSPDTMDGTEWVYLRANPDKSETQDHTFRMKFSGKSDALKLKYNVGSVSSMYDYNCRLKPKKADKPNSSDEFICKEEPKVKDWCQALVAGGGKCTPETLKKIDSGVTDEQIKKGMAEAEEVMKKFRNTPNWDRFVFTNNNLGNKLQGILYAKLDIKKCRLRVTDNYITIYNAKKIEDSNPAGTNPFVKNELGELLWEACKNAEDLVSLTSAEFPKDPKNVSPEVRLPLGKEVHFRYLGADGLTPKEGCTYSADFWLSGKPFKKGIVPDTIDGRGGPKLNWHLAHTFNKPILAPPGDVAHMVRTTTCPGAEPVIETSCRLFAVDAPKAADAPKK